MEALGIDIGGTGIKGAPVNTNTGEMLAERYRIETPQPATPKAMLDIMGEIVRHFDWSGVIGCGYPGVVRSGVVITVANLDKKWLNYDLQQGLERLTHCPVHVLNDADAAGIAEMTFGAGRGRDGLVMVITLGTGIGTAAFMNGLLIPNLELGHIEHKGVDAETRVAYSAREREKMSYKKWAKRVDGYLRYIEFLFSPSLFIIGGGVSKNWDKIAPHLDKVQTEVVPAQMLNQAGIVGAAMAAAGSSSENKT